MVARGGAQRNPWEPVVASSIKPREGRKKESVAPAGASIYFVTWRSRGCAALHPWLPSVAPPGL